jgi:hypothetical protein
MEKIRFVGRREYGTEWAGEEDIVFSFKVDSEDVEVGFVHPKRAKREGLSEVYVIWEGALDFEGTKEEFEWRYPELAKKLKEVM